jgi:hypothetical protein
MLLIYSQSVCMDFAGGHHIPVKNFLCREIGIISKALLSPPPPHSICCKWSTLDRPKGQPGLATYWSNFNFLMKRVIRKVPNKRSGRVFQGVSMDFLKYRKGQPCVTTLRPAGSLWPPYYSLGYLMQYASVEDW